VIRAMGAKAKIASVSVGTTRLGGGGAEGLQVAGDQAGAMCAMAVVVVGICQVVYEIPKGHNPSFQALMAGVSSGIYEGHS